MKKQVLLVGVAVVVLLGVAVAVLIGPRAVRSVRRRLGLPLPVRAEAMSNDGSYNNVIFLHHSTGRNLIREGDVRALLTARGYRFWDHDYNKHGLTRPDGSAAWISYGIPELEPGAVGGGNTDPPGLAVLFAQPVQDPPRNAFSRLLKHEVLIFKSCFPNSAIGSEADLDRLKGLYLGMRQVMAQHPDRLFILLTTPPLHPIETNAADAARARAMAQWLTSDEFVGGHPNLRVFDYYTLLADPSSGMLRSEYQIQPDQADSHPNEAANRAIGPQLAEFVDRAIQEYRATR